MYFFVSLLRKISNHLNKIKMKKKLTESDVKYGILFFHKGSIDLSSVAGNSILLEDSMGQIEATVHNTVENRIDGLTVWHRTRMTKPGDEISVQYDKSETEDGMNVIHIEFLSEREYSECEMQNSEFILALESQLRDYLANNIGKLEGGLIVEQTEYKIGTNRIDLLCVDKNRNYVIVELKNRKTGDQVVGQILRYIGCLKDNKKVNNVRGIIVSPQQDTNLEYAISELSNVSVKYFKLNIEFTDSKLLVDNEEMTI